MGLTKYQEKTVKHLVDVFQRQNIYLVADEVGLGKTYVAKGLIEAASYRRILYIASNPEIAKQNADKLGGTVIERIDRLSMLGSRGQKPQKLEAGEVYVLPVSPATSFTGAGSEIGNDRERGYYRDNLGKVTDARLPEDFWKKLKKNKGDSHKRDFARIRRMFCDYAVKTFQPDLIIMDEFHRFSKLVNPNGVDQHYSLKQLIQTANEGRRDGKVKILLLSATPYVFNTQKFERKYEGADAADKKTAADDEVDQYAEEFKDFQTLTHFICGLEEAGSGKDPGWQLNTPGDYYAHILCRTERKWLQGGQRDVPIRDLLEPGRNCNYGQAKRHLEYRCGYQESLLADEAWNFVFPNDVLNNLLKEQENQKSGKDLEKARNELREKLLRLAQNRLTGETIARPENRKKGIQTYSNLRTFLDEAPEYAQFGDAYASVTRGEKGTEGTAPELREAFSQALLAGSCRLRKEADDELLAQPGLFEQTYGHAKWDELRRVAVPEGAHLRLWIPPTKNGEAFSKTMVFTHYRMSTRAVAALTSLEAQKRLVADGSRKGVDLKKLPAIVFSPEVLEQLTRPVEDYFRIKNYVCSGEYLEQLGEKIKVFFNTTHARRVLSVWSGAAAAQETVLDYCREYDWNDMLTEYLDCLCDFSTNVTQEKAQKAAGTLLSVLDWEDNDRTRVMILPDWKDQGYPCTYGERYTADYSDKKAHDTQKTSVKGGKRVTTHRLEYIRERFQSPFYPFVLAASETAQEGVDLHNYCASIFHWSVPSRLNTFMQETGRVDRRASLTQRRQAVWLANRAGQPVDTLAQLFEKIDEVYQKLGWKAEEATQLKEQGLFPYWFLPAREEWLGDAAFPQLERVLFHLPVSRDEEDFLTLLAEQESYRTFGLTVNGQTCSGEQLRDALCPLFVDP